LVLRQSENSDLGQKAKATSKQPSEASEKPPPPHFRTLRTIFSNLF
jgi:hypothetical protein